MFIFFDKNSDGIVDFEEFIRGIDHAERGSFEEKCQYCFEIYDLYGLKTLDIFTLRQLLKKSYSQVIVKLEKISSQI